MNPLATSAKMGRRELLGSLGLMALPTLAGQVPAAADNPAAQVADRASSIRITALKATICRDRVFVRLDTNQKVSGWGEVKGVVPKVAATLAEAEQSGEEPRSRLLKFRQLGFQSGSFLLVCVK